VGSKIFATKSEAIFAKAHRPFPRTWHHLLATHGKLF